SLPGLRRYVLFGGHPVLVVGRQVRTRRAPARRAATVLGPWLGQVEGGTVSSVVIPAEPLARLARDDRRDGAKHVRRRCSRVREAQDSCPETLARPLL